MNRPKTLRFNFLGYSLDSKSTKINFDYQIEFSNREPLDFTETIILPKTPKNLSKETWAKFLEPLHLILGISYYKLYIPPEIRIPFKLSKDQAQFWNKVYRKGLGEFLYRNNLNPSSIPEFPSLKPTSNGYPANLGLSDRALLGIGGGKDSIVAAQLLYDYTFDSFIVETQKEDLVSEAVTDLIGKPLLKIKRIIDPKIFEHHEGAYNGHIPISAIFAFLGLLSAALYDYKYVIVGNEHSSNFGNLEYKGETINHQWSKSAEFESMLQEYTSKYITPDITYFSLLRQFYEIRIAQMFVNYKKYFPVFTSCNTSFKVFKKRPNNRWCGECPKCAFAFLLLAAFLKKEEVLQIFDKNLLADKKLLSLFRDILGFGSLKPFDCVGTFEESQAALFLASKKFNDELVVKTFLPKIKNPQELVKQVFKTAPADTLPRRFRFLGIKSVCVLGYGLEGKVTEAYLKKYYPDLKIGILDKNLDNNYLEKQEDYDLAIKTPGIPKYKVTIPYTTATNIFFSRNKNFTIGITGTKGKSTTTTLIYEILKEAGHKVRLLGNIGEPMLGAFFEKIDPQEIFVIELSSYMLDDIEYSPNIAVLLNLFPEHMDYHGNIQKYYEAKRNIFKFQNPSDYLVKEPFTEKIPLKKSEIPLLGPHNLENIKAAVKVARLLKIPESTIVGAIKSFKPLPHRLEFVDEVKGIRFYDDAISTTPESTIMAIKSLKKIGTIFLGGYDRGYDFNELEKTLRKYEIKNIVLFPDSGKRIIKSREGLNILETRSMKEAIDFAFKNTPRGEICVLSTASPSYSLWKNFEEKGDEFKKYVQQFSQSGVLEKIKV